MAVKELPACCFCSPISVDAAAHTDSVSQKKVSLPVSSEPSSLVQTLLVTHTVKTEEGPGESGLERRNGEGISWPLRVHTGRRRRNFR